MPSAVEVWSPKHWTPMNFPHLFLLLFLLLWDSSLRKYWYDSSRGFMVSLLIIKSASHLMYGVKEFSTFIDLHAAVQLSQSHLSRKLSFLLPPLSRIN